MKSCQHTRTVGKKFTYDVTIYPTRYVISLDGEVLKDAGAPIVLHGGVSGEEATAVFAIDDIEKLVGMNEE